jgi:hypothetical protein
MPEEETVEEVLTSRVLVHITADQKESHSRFCLAFSTSKTTTLFCSFRIFVKTQETVSKSYSDGSKISDFSGKVSWNSIQARIMCSDSSDISPFSKTHLKFGNDPVQDGLETMDIELFAFFTCSDLLRIESRKCVDFIGEIFSMASF